MNWYRRFPPLKVAKVSTPIETMQYLTSPCRQALWPSKVRPPGRGFSRQPAKHELIASHCPTSPHMLRCDPMQPSAVCVTLPSERQRPSAR